MLAASATTISTTRPAAPAAAPATVGITLVKNCSTMLPEFSRKVVNRWVMAVSMFRSVITPPRKAAALSR